MQINVKDRTAEDARLSPRERLKAYNTKFIREFLEGKGITLQRMAADMGVTTQAVSYSFENASRTLANTNSMLSRYGYHLVFHYGKERPDHDPAVLSTIRPLLDYLKRNGIRQGEVVERCGASAMIFRRWKIEDDMKISYIMLIADLMDIPLSFEFEDWKGGYVPPRDSRIGGGGLEQRKRENIIRQAEAAKDDPDALPTEGLEAVVIRVPEPEDGDLYRAARMWLSVSQERIARANLALVAVDFKVRAVYSIDGWERSEKNLSRFFGREERNSRLLGKDVRHVCGRSVYPLTYINI